MAGHSHDHPHHDHDHDDHAPITDHDGPVSRHELLEIALRELLVDKGVLGAADIPAQIERTESRTPALGAQIVARAWTDPEFRARLTADPRATLGGEMGLDLGHLAELAVIENDADTHNVVVCTLCSCYPRMILGAPPSWYKSTAYRARVVRAPREVLAEFGVTLPAGTKVQVHDSTADLRFLVIPRRPDSTEGWDAEALAGLVTRDSMIGTGLPRDPADAPSGPPVPAG